MSSGLADGNDTGSKVVQPGLADLVHYAGGTLHRRGAAQFTGASFS